MKAERDIPYSDVLQSSDALGVNKYDNIEEVRDGIITKDELQEKLDTGEVIILNGLERSVAIGNGVLVKVNTSIGINGTASKGNIDEELRKVKELSTLGYRPDLMMDLSIRVTDPPIYRTIAEIFGGPLGTLPHYLCYTNKDGVDGELLLSIIEHQASSGVAFMTMHPTPTKELYDMAVRTRKTPITSRGGGIVVDDMLINNRRENIIADLFPEVLAVLKANDVAISIGSTFRPANVVDSLDEVQRLEYQRQKIFIDMAKEAGVKVMMEGVGHMTMNKITEYAEMVKAYKVPFMPLGPMTTDASVGEDHITNAVGGSFMAFLGAAHVLNSVTREEHTGKIPTFDSILEGLRAARIAEHSVNIARFPQQLEPDTQVSDARANNYTCVVEGGLFTESAKRRFSMGCTRCGNECPLLVNRKVITLNVQN